MKKQKLTAVELAGKVLKEENRPLTQREIWKIAVQKGYDKLWGTTGKTPWSTICAKLYVEMRDNSNSPFCIAGKKPRKFGLKSFEKSKQSVSLSRPKVVSEPLQPLPEIIQPKAEVPEKSLRSKKSLNYLEKDLHPFLTYFAFHNLKCYTKTLEHQTSEKKESGKWMHPDIVGWNFSSDSSGEDPKIIEFRKTLGNITIFSFELKRELTFSNLHEAFFQAVSNSSWANAGYLVAAEISEKEDFMNELQRLSGSFGIGIIKLNIENPEQSEIIFSAKLKSDLDWESVKKLSRMNIGFGDFIGRVTRDKSGEPEQIRFYDDRLDLEKLKRTIKA